MDSALHLQALDVVGVFLKGKQQLSGFMTRGIQIAHVLIASYTLLVQNQLHALRVLSLCCAGAGNQMPGSVLTIA